MSKRTIWKRMSSLALVLAVLFALVGTDTAPLVETASAVTQGDIDALKDDADALADEKSAIKSRLSELRNEKANMLERRVLLDQQIAVTEKEIANTENQIAGYQALLTQTALELEENQKEEEERYELFCERTRVMEENGTASYWAVLFNAEDFSDLLSRLADIQEVMDYDQSVLDNLREIRAEIEAKQAYQEELKTEAEAAKATLEATKADLSAQREEANALVAELESNVAEYSEQLAAVEEEEEAIQKEIVEKTNQLAAQMGWNATVGGYIWPVTTSRRITSPYGNRNTGIPAEYHTLEVHSLLVRHLRIKGYEYICREKCLRLVASCNHEIVSPALYTALHLVLQPRLRDIRNDLFEFNIPVLESQNISHLGASYPNGFNIADGASYGRLNSNVRQRPYVTANIRIIRRRLLTARKCECEHQHEGKSQYYFLNTIHIAIKKSSIYVFILL